MTEQHQRREEDRGLEGLRGKERAAFRRALYCGHLFCEWHTRPVESDGRLHAFCPDCGAAVSRPPLRRAS